MAIIKAKVKDKGGRLGVDLPTYTFVKEITKTVWEIEVPDEYITNDKLDNKKIRAMYTYSNDELARCNNPTLKTKLAGLKTNNFEKEQEP